VDPALVAGVEDLEGTIVAGAHGGDEAILVDVVCNDAGRLGDAAHSTHGAASFPALRVFTRLTSTGREGTLLCVPVFA
jgi:hypothetical protein